MSESPAFIPDYLFLGHITHDVTPDGPRLGGTVSYGAHTAVAMGQKVGILTSAKPDEPLLADLPASVRVINIPAEHTTMFENRYVGSARTQYMYHRALTLTPAMLPPAWRQARLIHIAPIAYEVDLAFFTFFEQGAICVTPQGFMRRREADGLVKTIHWADADRALPHVRLTVFSEEDIQHDPSLEHTFARLSPIAVLTRAERGGTVYQGAERADFAAIEVEQVGPTGAGDVFASALHIALDRLGDLPRAIRVAAYLAGRSITREGFDSAPTPDEIATAWAMVGV
ncbi:MAG: hypothetical protein JXA10_09640 [Anaerolineae bacterium]|nr:hypothetical protein [Anaerolineae bacterium]